MPIFKGAQNAGIREMYQPVSEKAVPHLRSVSEVKCYHIQALDGKIGRVEDFILDDVIWNLRYLIIETRSWLPCKKVFIVPFWLEKINWADAGVRKDLTREEIRNSPEYDPGEPVNREYEHGCSFLWPANVLGIITLQIARLQFENLGHHHQGVCIRV